LALPLVQLTSALVEQDPEPLLWLFYWSKWQFSWKWIFKNKSIFFD